MFFWLQRNLQDFGVAHDLLIAGGGDSFPRDPVHLIEGVGLKDPLVGRPDEDLKPQGLVFHVAMELNHRVATSWSFDGSSATFCLVVGPVMWLGLHFNPQLIGP